MFGLFGSRAGTKPLLGNLSIAYLDQGAALTRVETGFSTAATVGKKMTQKGERPG
jgi:hypothetical protein